MDFIRKFARREIVLQAILVGIISGLFAVLFRYSIGNINFFLFETLRNFSLTQKLVFFPFVTALGGLIAGILVCKIAPESAGSGIPEIKYFLAKSGQKIRTRVIAVKFLAGIAGIGAGLSLGREGPSVQLGGGAGAMVAKMFKTEGIQRKNLVAAGAGAAIAATFNAPIAATIFVLEELVHAFKSALLFPVIIATVTASVLARFLLGNNYAFEIPEITIHYDYQNIPVYVALGIAAGLIGVAFTRNILFNLQLFERINGLPDYAKPALAGYITGLAGVFLPYILGPGNEAVDMLLEGKIALFVVFLVIAGKFFLTSFCFGSGAAGGLFLPTIMLGAFIGYFTGAAANCFLGVEVDPVVVSLVGMGAFLSSVARTPLTAVVIVFELTGDYIHILPIMLSAAIADLIADKLKSPSVYNLLMLRKEQKLKAKTPAQPAPEAAVLYETPTS